MRTFVRAILGLVCLALNVSAQETVVGWRNDGTGRFPSANPPAEWGRAIKNGRVEVKNIVWMTPVFRGASSPIVAGRYIFFGADPASLICMDKATGKILWIRDHNLYAAAADVEKAPVREKGDPIAAQIKKLDNEAIQAANEAVSATGPSDEHPLAKISKQLNRLQRELDAVIREANPKKFTLHGTEWEYASATPVTDGKFVYMWFSNRAVVCYDLDGNRQWINIEPREDAGNTDHGRQSSPALVADKFIVQYDTQTIAFDRKTGKLLWNFDAGKAAGNTIRYGSLVVARVGRQQAVINCAGQGIRVTDGKSAWGILKGFKGANSSMIVEGDTLFSFQPSGIFEAKLSAQSAGENPVEPAKSIKFDYKSQDHMISSPLFADELVYCVTDAGMLHVFDAAAGNLAWEKKLPIAPLIAYIIFPGVSCSPALAGKNIYIADNQGNTVVIQPGREYQQVALNHIETPETDKLPGKSAIRLLPQEGKVNEQTISNFFFDGDRIYIRGQQYMYCIGRK